MIETKSDLLNAMWDLFACPGATAWAHDQEGTAEEIWLRCEEVDWLVWFAGRRNPTAIAAFARRCADRAASGPYAHLFARAAADAADRCANAAGDYAARYVASYAAEAATHARCAAASWRAEVRPQRDDLHAMWSDIR